MNRLDELKQRYPWPERMPPVPTDDHGWFQACNARVLAQFLGPETRLVVELGSWLGKSSRFIVQRSPQATLVAIDHWRGSREHHRPGRADVRDRLPRLYETFLRNCWPWRDRIVPMRTSTVAGMKELAALGLAPELVYVDAGHELDDVLADLRTATALFPDAQLVGDDYATYPGVREAVQRMASHCGLNIEVDENAWILGRSRLPDGTLASEPTAAFLRPAGSRNPQPSGPARQTGPTRDNP
jgi:hypothetical protein